MLGVAKQGREEQYNFLQLKKEEIVLLRILDISPPPFRPLHLALLYNIVAGLMKRQAREVVFIIN